jgi:hypothetical protein
MSSTMASRLGSDSFDPQRVGLVFFGYPFLHGTRHGFGTPDELE